MTDKKISTHFRCPHANCQKIIEKPFQYQLMAQQGGVAFVRAENVACPFCGHGINRMDIINGTLDCPSTELGWFGSIIFLVVLWGGLGFLILFFSKAC